MEPPQIDPIQRGTRHVSPPPARPRSGLTYGDLLKSLAHTQRKQRARNLKIAFAVIAAVLLVSVGAWQGYNYFSTRSMVARVPAQIRTQPDYPIYIPTHSDYQLSSFTYSGDILTFVAKRDGNQLVFTEQPKPANFVFSNFSRGQGISEADEIDTDLGKALLGKVLQRKIAILVADDQTLVTVTAASDAGDINLAALLKELYKIEP